MRTALYLTFALTAAAVLAGGMLSAEEEGLRTERFDVSVLVQVHSHQRGALLGAPAPSDFDDPKAAKPPKPAEFVGADELADIVRQRVDPRTWEEVDGASLSPRGRWLRVRNRPEVVKHVAEYLYQLSMAAQQRLLLSVEIAEGESAGYPVLPEGASVASSGSLALPFGIERSLARTSRVQHVTEYDVEIAQGSNISDPIVVSADEGLLANFIATPSIDGERVVIEALVQTAAYGTPRRMDLGADEEYMPGPYRSDTRSTYGTLELPRYDHVQTHFTTILPASGGTLSLPVAVRGRMAVLRLNARVPAARSQVDVIDLGAMVQEPMPVVFGKLMDEDLHKAMYAPRVRYVPKSRPPASFGTVEHVLDDVISSVSRSYWEDSLGEMVILGQRRLFVRADAQRLAAVRSHLRELERQAVRPVVVDLRVWSKRGPVASGPVKTFSREGAQLVAAGRMPTIMGRTASLMAGSTANYLADYDVEVAQEARIADPIVGQGFDGLVVNLLPTLSLNGRTVNVALEMLLARRTLSDRTFESGARFLGPIDDLRQDRSVVDTTVQLAAGDAYVIDLGVDPEHKDRRLIAELHVELP